MNETAAYLAEKRDDPAHDQENHDGPHDHKEQWLQH
jgi:hypothetical protein